MSSLTLKRSDLITIVFVMLQEKIDKAIAKIANAVEKNNFLTHTKNLGVASLITALIELLIKS